jgi:signal peptidase I
VNTLAVVIFAVLVTALVVLRVLLLRVTVHGTSMLPTLSPGDRVLVRRATARAVRRGDLVVFARPREATRSWMIKRVLAVPGDPVPRAEVPTLSGYREPVVPPGRLVVLGDNPADSYDSRQFGYVRDDRMLGVVVRWRHEHLRTGAVRRP